MQVRLWTKEELDYLNDNYLSMTDKELAIHFNRTEAAVATKRKKIGLIRDKHKYTFQDVLDEFSKTEYELISNEDDYFDTATNSIKYICPKHREWGVQTISLGHLLGGRGCYYCGREKTAASKIILEERNILECKKICESKGFEFKKVYKKNNRFYIQYVCLKHPEKGIQEMQKGNMSRDTIVGCPYCFGRKKSKITKGELRVEEVLTDLNIKYKSQYGFDSCRDVNKLLFDYYLPDYNMCIEYDGRQHFEPVRFGGISEEQAITNFEITQAHDLIKTDYCISNNISLLRIPYQEHDNIEALIKEALAS